MPSSTEIVRTGWREWVALPELGLSKIKAKMDTGARTSTLHAFHLEYFIQHHVEWVRFFIHPYQRKLHPVIACEAVLKDMRWISDSGGHREERPVIETLLCMGEFAWPIEITLTSRDDMRFRMLVGRTAMKNKMIIDPTASYLVGKKPRKQQKLDRD